MAYMQQIKAPIGEHNTLARLPVLPHGSDQLITCEHLAQFQG
jgi:hypothetical protein